MSFGLGQKFRRDWRPLPWSKISSPCRRAATEASWTPWWAPDPTPLSGRSPGGNCIKIGLPGKSISDTIFKRIGLHEDLFPYWESVFPEDLFFYNSSQNGVESVRDGQDRAVGKFLPDGGLDEVVGLQVDGRRRLVQYEHFRLPGECSTVPFRFLICIWAFKFAN